MFELPPCRDVGHVHGDFLHIRIATAAGDERDAADELVYRWEVMGSPAR